MRISVQIGGFRRKTRMASTYGIYATDAWLWLYCNFLEICVLLIAASLRVELLVTKLTQARNVEIS
jgi:hypothetical protein